ncbi:hypothetical protein BZA05DRAFT_446947 [Tricharina praecox]|uniref:uncharacterized protein n=1 Tax=Tricharina praecox TaxID=43433 RepID=UPI00221FD139|nr:uncharacterized protein BZA05DRAFT_446947 [Tricharina praecox]KAI5847459.1 hypothetical protein BZA05DRAFT_446947 [Tricharina praecox]
MAGDEGRSEKSTSIRRRLTTSIKRVMSYTSSKSNKSSGSMIASEPQSPIVASSSAAVTATTAAPVVLASTPAPTRLTEKPAHKPAHKPYRPPKNPTSPPPVMSAAERAQALFKKHGLDVKSTDLPLSTTPQSDRVQKDIRMRVHRSCHKCETPYGADKTCLECGHKRCKKCPRHPLKKSKDKGKEKVTTKTGIAPGYKKRKGDIAYGITIPGRRGGQDLVRKEVRQRVHRKCHRCDTDFASEKVCGKCKHNRCKKCPRHPSPKGGKDYGKNDPTDSEPDYPAPPRRTYKKPRRRVHWTCNNCQATFIEKTKLCGGCGSNRDDTGVRDPPKKPKYKPTDSEVQRLNDRLKQTSLSAA